MKWTILMPVLNEVDIIESKLEYLKSIGRTVVVEGSIPQTYDVGPNGLSTDGTTEILKSYSDKINYIAGGKYKDRKDLQNAALFYIHKNFPETEILWTVGTDEFISMDAKSIIDKYFETAKGWLLYWDLLNLADPTRGFKDNAPISRPFPFSPGKIITAGIFHERFYRYRNDLNYLNAHCMGDSFGRPLYMHPDYYFHRHLFIPDTKDKIFHYKYIDGLRKLLKAEMSYLVEDERMIPNSEENFDRAKETLKKKFEKDEVSIKKEWHPIEVQKSKWFKYEPITYNWNISLDQVLL